MTLGELETRVLLDTQQPGLSTSTPLGNPNWSSLTNPDLTQGVVDYCINKGYERVMAELGYLQIVEASFTVNVVPNQFYYTINPPPAGNPNISRPLRVQYTPTGLNYTAEYLPGYDFIPWSQFLRRTGNLYYLQAGASSATIPDIVSVVPGRTQIAFYPSGTLATDTFTLFYTPLPTAGAAQCPTLVNPSDVPILPLDTHEAIVLWAERMLWNQLRLPQMMEQTKEDYREEINRIKATYLMAHPGDTMSWDTIDYASWQAPGM